MHTLPPLNALRAFEAIAQSGSIRAASEILNVTQSSISRHLSVIEEFLQVKLFHREGRGLVLTEAGRDYLLRITPALEAIGEATQAVSRNSRRKTLTLSAPPTLIANWLMPKLKSFLDEYSDIDLRIIAGMTLKQSDVEIDCAIEYRFTPIPEYLSVLLLQDEIVPVISPHHFNMDEINSLDDLKGIPLIDTARRLISWYNILNNKNWFQYQPMISVSHTVHAIEAALQGMGIALVNRHNANRFIEKGALVIPFDFETEKIPKVPQYYFSCFKHKENDEVILALKDCLLLHKNV